MKSLETRITALEPAKLAGDTCSAPDYILEAMMVEYFGHVPTDEELTTLAQIREKTDSRD